MPSATDVADIERELEAVKTRVGQLERQRNDAIDALADATGLSRRQVLGIIGGGAGMGALGMLASQEARGAASTSDAQGDVGTPSNPFDGFADGLAMVAEQVSSATTITKPVVLYDSAVSSYTLTISSDLEGPSGFAQRVTFIDRTGNADTNNVTVEDSNGTEVAVIPADNSIFETWWDSGEWVTDRFIPTVDAGTVTADNASIADIDNLTQRVTGETDRIIGAVDWALIDDWGDNALTGRTDPVTDHHVNVVDGRVDAVYRPEWTTVSGSPTASSGALNLPAGNSTAQEVSTPFGLRVGEWEFDYQWSTNPTAGEFQWNIIEQDVDNRIVIRVLNDGTITLTSRIGGVNTNIVSSAKADDTNEHRIRVTRDWNGNWEVFWDGTSLGTGTDADLPTLNNMNFNNGADAAIDVPHARAYR